LELQTIAAPERRKPDPLYNAGRNIRVHLPTYVPALMPVGRVANQAHPHALKEELLLVSVKSESPFK
jgi:hypothetical protein